MKKSIVFITACLATAGAHAAVLVQWNLHLVDGTVFAHHSPFIAVSASNATLAANMSTTDLTDSNNNNGFTGGGTGLHWSNVSPGGNPAAGKLNLVNWSSSANNIGNWLEFTMTADAGAAIALDSVDLRAWRNGGGAPLNWSIQVFDPNASVWNAFGTTHVQNATGVGTATNVTFTGAASADTLRVRFVATGGTNTGNLHIESLVINGTVIPEPATFLLGGLGLLGLLRRRR